MAPDTDSGGKNLISDLGDREALHGIFLMEETPVFEAGNMTKFNNINRVVGWRKKFG